MHQKSVIKKFLRNFWRVNLHVYLYIARSYLPSVSNLYHLPLYCSSFYHITISPLSSSISSASCTRFTAHFLVRFSRWRQTFRQVTESLWTHTIVPWHSRKYVYARIRSSCRPRRVLNDIYRHCLELWYQRVWLSLYLIFRDKVMGCNFFMSCWNICILLVRIVKICRKGMCWDFVSIRKLDVFKI